ncbi:AIG2-like family protein [mine drainage metagenome]|uniref:AIG2-like family protein n=1 Tax=mine drainage metagenome TaxID=410659 RepID=A0A1J5SF75_9ZZZZ
MNERRDILLFSYGTLQQDAVQLTSFGRLLEGYDDALPGYRQALLEITDAEVLRQSGKRFHPIVMPSDDPADEIPGKVFLISRRELDAADRYEVADYKRIAVGLASGRTAWVYVQK